MAIELRQIKKVYCGGDSKKCTVLSNLDFQMQDGAMISILGKSGSGKTTLLRILGLLEKPDQGQYFWNGKDMGRYKRKWNQFRNQKIGFVMQDYALFETLNAFDNIAAPMYISHRPHKEVVDSVLSLAERFQIGDLLEKKVCYLSGGEKQRVAIARAMIQKPELLLADEPTGALDEDTANLVWNTLKEINQMGTTILVVTHDKNIAFSCNKVYHLQDGKLELA